MHLLLPQLNFLLLILQILAHVSRSASFCSDTLRIAFSLIPIDRHAQRAQQQLGRPKGGRPKQGTVDQCGRSTGMYQVSVGNDRPTGRLKEGVGRPARSTDRRICFSCWNSDFVFKKNRIQLRFPKILKLSDYK